LDLGRKRLDVKGCSPDVKKLESNFVSSENVISKKAYSVFDANLFELGKNTIEQENNLKFSKKGNYYYHSVRKDGVGYLEKNSKSKN